MTTVLLALGVGFVLGLLLMVFLVAGRDAAPRPRREPGEQAEPLASAERRPPS